MPLFCWYLAYFLAHTKYVSHNKHVLLFNDLIRQVFIHALYKYKIVKIFKNRDLIPKYDNWHFSFVKAGSLVNRIVCWSYYTTVAPHPTSPWAVSDFDFYLPIRLFTLIFRLYLAFLSCDNRLFFTIAFLFCISQCSPCCLTHVILPVFCCYFAFLGDKYHR